MKLAMALMIKVQSMTATEHLTTGGAILIAPHLKSAPKL
jgi:hypothetical protein